MSDNKLGSNQVRVQGRSDVVLRAMNSNLTYTCTEVWDNIPFPEPKVTYVNGSLDEFDAEYYFGEGFKPVWLKVSCRFGERWDDGSKTFILTFTSSENRVPREFMFEMLESTNVLKANGKRMHEPTDLFDDFTDEIPEDTGDE